MFALVAGFALIATPVDKPKELSEAAQKELKLLQGKWVAQKRISSAGEKEPGPNDKAITLEFKGRKLIAEEKERVIVSSIDPSTTPKCIDLEVIEDDAGVPKGTIFEGVYKIDGDTLTLAIHASTEKKRPANFDKPTEERTQVLIFKRVKE